jgi:hypothetical protein
MGLANNQVTLNTVETNIAAGLADAETAVSAQLAILKTGSTMSVADMIQLQFVMSAYTITASTFSAIMKEISDTLKSVVQKMS